MIKEPDYERQAKANLMAKRGTEVIVDEPLTHRQMNDIESAIERNQKTAERIVDEVRKNCERLQPINPAAQVANLEFLYRQLSSSQKREKLYGRFLKSKVNELRLSQKTSSEPLASRTPYRKRAER